MSARPPRAMLSVDVPSTPRSTTFPSPPAGISAGLAAVAERSLERLPDGVLRAMVTGIRGNADDLAPGALFRARDSGGCAVGVTLRELAPEAFQFGRIEFWLWHRWRRGVEPDVGRRFPQLQQLQRVFDDAVREVEEAGLEKEPAKAVGLWLATCAQALLDTEKVPAPHRRRLAKQPTRRNRSRPHPSLRGSHSTGTNEHHPTEIETTSCS